MPDAALFKDMGGWAAFATLALTVISLIVMGKLVPGPSHDRETRRADALDTRLDTLTTDQHDMAANVKTLAELLLDRARK